MKNTYLLDVISVLEPNERQEFLVFLESPFFNRGPQSKELVLLYQVILDAAPEFSETALDKKLVYGQVYPNKPMVEGKLEKLMAELNRLLRTFAIVNDQLTNEHAGRFQWAWIQWLMQRGIKSRFQQAISKYIAAVVPKKESLSQYKTLFAIAEAEHVWKNANNMLKGDLNIPKLLHRLDLYYLNYRSDLNIMFLIQQKAAKAPAQNIPDNLGAMEDISLPYSEQSSLLEMAQKFLQLFRKERPTVDDFRNMMLLLHSRESDFSFDTISLYYSRLRNFCTLLIDDGHIELVPTLHDLNKTNLENGYFSTENRIQLNAYLSLVQIALRAKDLEWALHFTETYKERIIGGDEQQFSYRLNLASCLLAAGDFQACLDQIPDTAPSSFYLMMVRRLELKAYYGLQSELLPYKIDAFRKFVERTAAKSVSSNIQIMNLNFVHILSQLTQSRSGDSKRSARLVARIQGKKLIGERSWLLEKALELG